MSMASVGTDIDVCILEALLQVVIDGIVADSAQQRHVADTCLSAQGLSSTLAGSACQLTSS